LFRIEDIRASILPSITEAIPLRVVVSVPHEPCGEGVVKIMKIIDPCLLQHLIIGHPQTPHGNGGIV
jgi:hypothetical protein